MCALLGTLAANARAQPAEAVFDPVAVEDASGRVVAVLDCPTGRALATIVVAEPLVAPPALPASGRDLYAATAGRELLRWSLPDGVLRARAPLGLDPLRLAAASGPDAIVLVGGAGPEPLLAFDATSLAPLRRYATQASATVGAVLDVPGRRRLVVAFADLDELWEIAYDRDAPPVLAGLVHDYRTNEAVPLPGRLTPRAFKVPGATRALVAGPMPWELARLDASGTLGVVNLDVRREIERPSVSAQTSGTLIAPWREGGARGWLVAGPPRGAEAATGGAGVADAAGGNDTGVVTPLTAPSGRALAPIGLPGPVDALASTAMPGRVLALLGGRASGTLVLVDVQTRGASVLRASASPLPGARLRMSASGRCVALVDAGGRWRASHLADGDRLVSAAP